MHEGRLRGMSTDYGKAKEDRKRLNEEINVLERKFKYASLRTSLGLSQDEQDKMQRELCIWKRQAREAQKKVTQLESMARAKDARHLKEIEELKAIATNEQYWPKRRSRANAFHFPFMHRIVYIITQFAFI